MSSESLFDLPVSLLPSVGEKRVTLLRDELGIKSIFDFFSYLPFRYDDRTEIQRIREIRSSHEWAQVVGTVRRVQLMGEGRKQRLEAFLEDDSGVIKAVWFSGVKWYYSALKIGRSYLLYGRVHSYRGEISLQHPEVTLFTEGVRSMLRIIPVYETSSALKQSKLDSRGFSKLMRTALDRFVMKVEDPIPEWVLRSMGLPVRAWAVQQIHFPDSREKLNLARRRLAFEEFLFFQIRLHQRGGVAERQNAGIPFERVGDHFNDYYRNHLGFDLTDAQKRVLREIRADVAGGRQMNRLIQGDVGSGKTVVALFSVLLAVDNDTQACMMAPTEILAQQHYLKIRAALEPLGLMVALLTGSTSVRDRREIERLLLSGHIHLLIGTHALLEGWVQFRRLGLVIIDEQHRFGVEQRARMWEKGDLSRLPHVLIMTATPIPRTLALTLYGDLDVSVIDALPPGRKPITTLHILENNISRVYQLIAQEVGAGRQVYVVYPLIEESEILDLQSLEEGRLELSGVFPSPKYRIGVMHGRMPPSEKEVIMASFQSGAIDILISTTVIEVGVDVPNATVMVIRSAQQFGLSQLHQLRGRVGRGADKSYCLLVTPPALGDNGRRRMRIMVETQDGFRIAEEDMKIRGAGNPLGTQQSGFNAVFRAASLQVDQDLLQRAQGIAREIVEKDPNLEEPQCARLRQWIEAGVMGEGNDYRQIG